MFGQYVEESRAALSVVSGTEYVGAWLCGSMVPFLVVTFADQKIALEEGLEDAMDVYYDILESVTFPMVSTSTWLRPRHRLD